MIEKGMEMRNSQARLLAAVISVCVSTGAQAFEVTTHGALTREAWATFMRDDPGLLDRLGIKNVDDPFGTKLYFDYRPTETTGPRVREGNGFELGIMETLSVSDPFSPRGWMIRGAIREDDDIDPEDPSPKEDSYGDFHRVFGHFHDPVNDRGLTYLGATLGPRAADWGLDANASTPAFPPFFIPGAIPTPQRSNNFGLATFNESLWRALTGMNQAGLRVASSTAERSAYWTTAFRSLGDILHLNQDMAQPQHTRNDRHAGGDPRFVRGHKSVFERYVDARIRGAGTFSTRDNPADTSVVISPARFSDFGSYVPTPKFSRYGDYWTRSDGKGLANYSNAGFFSIGTLNGAYASPSSDRASYTPVQVPLTRWNGAVVPGKSMTLYQGAVPDLQSGVPATNQNIFAQSAWDEAAQGLNLPFARITLTKANYDDAMNLLIPRAVAYSAGILQHAFRGQLEVSPPGDGIYAVVDHSQVNQSDDVNGFAGFAKIKLKLKNITSGENMGGGKLVAVAKFHRNPCYQADLAGEFNEQNIDSSGNYFIPGCDLATYPTPEEESLMSDVVDIDPVLEAPVTLNAGDPPKEFVFNFTYRQIPINATNVKIQVVYRGNLGQDADVVAVAMKDISEPTYLAVLNSTDYFVWGGHYYTQATAPAGMPRDSQGNLPETTNPVARTFRLYFSPTASSPAATILSLQPGHYARLAVLSELPSYYARAVIHRPEDDVAVAALGGAGWTAEQNDETTISLLGTFRNMRYFSLMWYFRSVDGTNAANDAEVSAPASPLPDPVNAVNF